jgi:hypothetical protein
MLRVVQSAGGITWWERGNSQEHKKTRKTKKRLRGREGKEGLKGRAKQAAGPLTPMPARPKNTDATERITRQLYFREGRFYSNTRRRQEA